MLLGEWRARAACLGQSSDIFFPEVGNHDDHERADELRREALAICASCPVITECRDYAVRMGSNLPYGIWGGLTARDRRRMRRLRTDAHRPPTSHAIAGAGV